MNLRLLLLSLTLSLCLLGCTGHQLVERAPPSPKQEQVPLKPSSDVIWQPGHWAYDEAAGHYYWVSGVWARPVRDKIWIPGYWRAVETGEGRRWEWVDPHWDDAPE